MARKRKIPTRKHHGIRDPLVQLELKEKKLANVTNNPPTDNGEQRVSYKFKQFKRLVEAAETGKKLKIPNAGMEDKPKHKNLKPQSSKSRNIKQLNDETDADYLRRVSRITNASVREAEYEAKYGVNVIRDSKTGEITIKKKPVNEIDELLKRKQKERKAANSIKKKNPISAKSPTDIKLNKELIKLALMKAQKDKNEAQNVKEEYKRDFVKFGEVVHAPPTFKKLPRKPTTAKLKATKVTT